MADRSKIEWTEASWNPIRAANKATGRDGHFCVHVSEGCRNCYAERMQVRFGNPVRFAAQDRGKVQIFLHETALLEPLRWKRPRMIFVCSMTDLFADFVSTEMIDRVFAVMALAPQHTFQVLTKRPERMRGYMADEGLPFRIADAALIVGRNLPEGHPGWFVSRWKPSVIRGCSQPAVWPLPNVWLGTSVEDQATADARIPELLSTPAAVRWISAEPLLGPLDLRWIAQPDMDRDGVIDALAGRDWIDGDRFGEPFRPSRPGHQDRRIMRQFVADCPNLDWVVCGGESGARARLMHPDWARSLRDQCAAAGVAFFFKQWGGLRSKSGGRQLDGREWSELPIGDRL